MRHVFLPVSCFLLLLTVASRCQVEYFVDGVNGNDSNPGTWALPFLSISKGVAAATSGDTVTVRAAQYDAATTGESFPIRVSGVQNLTVRGAGPGRSMIDMAGRGGSTFFVANTVGCRITGFTLTASAAITDWWGAGFTVGNYLGTNGSTGLAIDHIVFDRVNRGVVLFQTTPPSNGCVVNDCAFLALTNDCVNEFTTGTNGFFGNTFAGSSYLGMTLDSPTSTVVNNVFFSNKTGVGAGVQLTAVNVVNNDFFANATAFTGPVDPGKNLAVDPQFVNSGAGDYRLSASSPLIDGGMTVAVMRTDVTGNPRLLDGNGDGSALADLGAYELAEASLGITGTWGLGQNVLVNIGSLPGRVGLLLFGRGEGNVFIPQAGNFLLDPARLLPFAFSVVTPGALGLNLPNDPSLASVRVHMQAIVVDAQARLRPTNERIEQF